MKTNEHNLQVACLKWFALQYPKYYDVIFAIPNGGQRNIITAKKLKAEGVKPGIPDLFLPVAKNGFHGLFIEMKSEKGVLSKHQKEMIYKLIENGYAVFIVHSFEDFVAIINTYLTEI